MDRLQAVAHAALAAMALFTIGCDESSTRAGAPPSRVVAVSASSEGSLEELCEIAPAPAQAPLFAFPELASGSVSAPTRPRWINVWATWCRPCVEEMPMIRTWAERMGAEGAGVELVFLSADASDEAIAAFRESHADAPETLRMLDPQALPQWALTIGLDEGATLPIHVLTDARGRVRCARTGAVGVDDYERVRDLVRGL